jgi:hypothetical protein
LALGKRAVAVHAALLRERVETALMPSLVAVFNSKRFWMLLFAISFSYNINQTLYYSKNLRCPSPASVPILPHSPTASVPILPHSPTASVPILPHSQKAAALASASASADASFTSIPEINDCANRSSTISLFSSNAITKVTSSVSNPASSACALQHTTAGSYQRWHVEKSHLLRPEHMCCHWFRAKYGPFFFVRFSTLPFIPVICHFCHYVLTPVRYAAKNLLAVPAAVDNCPGL